MASVPDLWITLLKSFGMLCVVLALLIALLWLMRRLYHGGGSRQPGLIRIRSSAYLAPKERIVLVDVMGEKLLLGVTPQQINLLARVSDENGAYEESPQEPKAGFRSLFKRKLSP
jgi:flagellar protein FliO/FliZ